MFHRNLEKELIELAGDYPVVSVMGPRQSGKTTLVRKVFRGLDYSNLELPDERLLAVQDPKAFLDRFPKGAILDEIQRVPELLSYIQVIVDERKEKGLFILTGSHQIELHEAISQSLAGRVGLLNLYPMTVDELTDSGYSLDVDDQIYHGFFPGIFHDNLNPTKAYRNYTQTYLEKDVRRISEIKNLIQFQSCLKLSAGRIGQILEYSSLGNDLGVSVHTVKHWLGVLEASYIVFRLKPYFENFGKRIVKSPKLFFTDVGLASYLLDIEQMSQVTRDPLRGNLFENLVILELVKYRYNCGLEPNLYFYRDSRQNEVDVIIKSGNELIPVEIKSAKTFNTDFLKGLRYFRKLVPERTTRGYVIYAGDQEQMVDGFQLLNYRNVTKIFKQ
ncbi:MAG: ATP-binding protein [Chlamydiia bacterium]|nr:ATP-binding protein [Chlamydiia bacterium]